MKGESPTNEVYGQGDVFIYRNAFQSLGLQNNPLPGREVGGAVGPLSAEPANAKPYVRFCFRCVDLLRRKLNANVLRPMAERF